MYIIHNMLICIYIYIYMSIHKLQVDICIPPVIWGVSSIASDHVCSDVCNASHHCCLSRRSTCKASWCCCYPVQLGCYLSITQQPPNAKL